MTSQLPTSRLRWSDWAAACILALLAVLVGGAAIGSWDIWWHLKTGELAFTRWSTLPVDEFSLTHPGRPWLYKDLGADVIFYGLYRLAGEWGLALFKLVAALVVMLMLVTLVRTRGVRGWLGWAVVGWAFSVVSFRVIARPEAFSLCLLPVMCLLVGRIRDHVESRGKSPIPFSVLLWPIGLQFLWANLHRGAMVGPVLLWGLALYVALLAALPERWRPFLVARRSAGASEIDRRRDGRSDGSPGSQPGTTPSARNLGATFAVAALASGVTLLNPSGFRLITQSLQVTGSDALASAISEWRSLDLVELWAVFPLSFAWLVGVAVAVPLALLLRRRQSRVGIWDLAVCAVFLWWGLKAARMLP